MPYGLRGLGDCTNVSNGVGVDSVSGDPCVIGTGTVVAVPPSGPAQYGTVVNGQVVPITPGNVSTPFSFSSIPTWGWAVGGGVLFLMFMGGRRR